MITVAIITYLLVLDRVLREAYNSEYKMRDSQNEIRRQLEDLEKKLDRYLNEESEGV